MKVMLHDSEVDEGSAVGMVNKTAKWLLEESEVSEYS